MSPEEWTLIAGMCDEWWPGKFERSQQDAWYVALDSFAAQAVVDALKALLARGAVHRPSLGELFGQLRADPSRPTFVEMLRLVYGPGGVLRARPQERTFPDLADRDRAYDRAARDRAAGMHPLIGAFVQRYGIDRLRHLELEHEVYGEMRRREIEQQWDEFCEATEDREVALIASGGGERRRSLDRFDPLAALAPAVPQIAAGEPSAVEAGR